jgi:hypothetical protein
MTGKKPLSVGMKLTMVAITAAGFYVCNELWGGAGLFAWFGICMAFGLAGALTTWTIALKLFVFAFGCTAVLLGGLTFAANRWGGVGAFMWTAAFLVFFYLVPVRWMKKRLP